MISFYKRYAKTMFDIGIIAVTIFLSMLVFSFLYGIAKPIFFGLVIYAITQPFTKFLRKRGIKANIAATISMLTFLILIVGAIVVIGIVGITQIEQLSKNIPQYMGYLQEHISSGTGYVEGKIDAISPDVIEKAKGYIGVIANKASIYLTAFLGSLIGFVTSVSQIIVNIGLGIILAYFLSIEIDTWKGHYETKVPRTFKIALTFFKEKVLKGLGSYLIAQLKLITITFFITFTGMLIIGAPNALVLAIISALLDLLPLLGIPVIFIPWAIYSFIMGDTTYAMWILGIMLVTMVIRQIVEPRIAGNSLGVSAFTMLTCMVVSLSLFGIAGFIMSPILLVTIKALHTDGYIKKWIRLPEDEYDVKKE